MNFHVDDCVDGWLGVMLGEWVMGTVKFGHARAGVVKLRPAGRMQPLTTFYAAHGALFKKYIPSL